MILRFTTFPDHLDRGLLNGQRNDPLPGPIWRFVERKVREQRSRPRGATCLLPEISWRRHQGGKYLEAVAKRTS